MFVSSALTSSQLESDRLYLEIPAHVLHTGDDPGETFWSLHELGVRRIVDGVGRDLEFLRHISQLPIDYLKIAKEFVEGLGRRPEDYILVEAIIRVGQMAGSEAVAVGVETEEQLSALQKLGCQVAQGLLFSEPASPDVIKKLLTQKRSKWHP